MVYGRYRRRRYSRSNRRSISNRTIFGKTSSKAQARQIATLRNRINKVYQRCKPEIKTIVTQAETKAYTSEAISSYYRFYPMASPELGAKDSERIGNTIHVINGVLYLSMEYYNSSTTGYHNTESAGAQYRIVIGQFNTKHASNSIPTISDLFEFPGNVSANYTQMAISPFKEGITSQYSILRDIRGTLTTERNQKFMKIAFKPKKPYIFDASGQFNNCWACLLVTGLHYDTDYTETVKITVSDKLVYTDA